MVVVAGSGVGLFVVVILGLFVVLLSVAGITYLLPQLHDLIGYAMDVTIIALVMLFGLVLLGVKGRASVRG